MQEFTQLTANESVTFLLKPDALAPYEQRVKDLNTAIEKIAKVVEADATEKEIADRRRRAGNAD